MAVTKRIEVILGRQKLRAFEGDDLFHECDCVTGKPGHETNPGRFFEGGNGLRVAGLGSQHLCIGNANLTIMRCQLNGLLQVTLRRTHIALILSYLTHGVLGCR